MRQQELELKENTEHEERWNKFVLIIKKKYFISDLINTRIIISFYNEDEKAVNVRKSKNGNRWECGYILFY